MPKDKNLCNGTKGNTPPPKKNPSRHPQEAPIVINENKYWERVRHSHTETAQTMEQTSLMHAGFTDGPLLHGENNRRATVMGQKRGEREETRTLMQGSCYLKT